MEHVPTVPELYAQGLATAAETDKKNNPTVYRVTPEGQSLIYAAMSRNVEEWKGLSDEEKKHLEVRALRRMPEPPEDSKRVCGQRAVTRRK